MRHAHKDYYRRQRRGRSSIDPGRFALPNMPNILSSTSRWRPESPGSPKTDPYGKLRNTVRGARTRSENPRFTDRATVGIPEASTTLATRPTVRLQTGQAGANRTACTPSSAKQPASSCAEPTRGSTNSAVWTVKPKL